MAAALKLSKLCVRALVRSRTLPLLLLFMMLPILSTTRKLLRTWRVHLPVTAKSIPKSAVFTPYHLTPGGGERVIFNMIAALQRLTDHSVDLLVTGNNVCQSTRCARQVALTLNIAGLDWPRIKVRTLRSEQQGYLIWIQMANSLFPPESSRGHFALYHCQFPFDGLRRVKDSDGGILRLSTYDIVYLNSRYTAHWYRQFMTSERRNFVQRHGFAPTLPPVTHFPPPFEPLRTVKQKDFTSVRIVLIGRFFDGRQGKRHLDAIKSFETFSSSPSIYKTSSDMSLTLVGNLAKGHKKYLRKVYTAAKAVHGVKILVGASKERLVSVLEDSNIVWSITGMGNSEADDPADAEHFGIALLEAMSTGMIPIVLNKGGPVEILDQFPKYLLINSVTELVESTSRLLQNSLSDLRDLSERARATAHDLNVFHKSFENIFNILRIQLTPDNAYLWMHTNEKVRAIQNKYGSVVSSDICNEQTRFTAKKAVVYMETRHDLALRTNLMTLLSTLGSGWVVQVWHSDANEHFMRSALDGLSCVEYRSLSTLKVGSTGDIDPRKEGVYQEIWKSNEFWSAIRRGSGNQRMETVLNFQSDAWFTGRSFDPSWLAYDYIGAPWCVEGNSGYLEEHLRPKYDERMLHNTRQLDHGVRVGNGGISLRDMSSMLDIIEKHRNESPHQENEDVFAVLSMKKERKSIADVSVASIFSLEVLCGDILAHTTILSDWKSFLELQDDPPRRVYVVHKPHEVFKQLAGTDSAKTLTYAQLSKKFVDFLL